MPTLIACAFEGKACGWRVRKCVPAPRSLIARNVSHRDGLLWISSNETINAGRFINPAKLIRSMK